MGISTLELVPVEVNDKVASTVVSENVTDVFVPVMLVSKEFNAACFSEGDGG